MENFTRGKGGFQGVRLVGAVMESSGKELDKNAVWLAGAAFVFGVGLCGQEKGVN